MQAHLIILICVLLTSFTRAAVTLIGPNTLNGSFESGNAFPWQGGVQVVNDPIFATDGSYYATLQASGLSSGAARQIAFQFLPANRSDGATFSVSFDARIGTTGFDMLSVDFFARNTDGTLIGSVETPAIFSGLSSSAWQTFQTQFHMPETWDGGGTISLQLLFSRSGTTSGTVYTGYLDNIALQQIPEPSTAGILCLGGIVVTVGRLLSIRIGRNRSVDWWHALKLSALTEERESRL
jgi:hypothetical protein